MPTTRRRKTRNFGPKITPAAIAAYRVMKETLDIYMSCSVADEGAEKCGAPEPGIRCATCLRHLEAGTAFNLALKLPPWHMPPLFVDPDADPPPLDGTPWPDTWPAARELHIALEEAVADK